MNKEELGKYTCYKKRVEKLKSDIKELKMKDVDTVAAKVKGSMREHPYTERRFSVQMEVPREVERISGQIAKKKLEVDALETSMREIEQFIENIEDVHVKSIFEYRYIQGMTCEDIGKELGYTHSRISQIISNYLKKYALYTFFN